MAAFKVWLTPSLYGHNSIGTQRTVLQYLNNFCMFQIFHNKTIDFDKNVALLQDLTPRPVEYLLHLLPVDTVGDRKSETHRTPAYSNPQYLRLAVYRGRRRISQTQIFATVVETFGFRRHE